MLHTMGPRTGAAPTRGAQPRPPLRPRGLNRPALGLPRLVWGGAPGGGAARPVRRSGRRSLPGASARAPGTRSRRLRRQRRPPGGPGRGSRRRGLALTPPAATSGIPPRCSRTGASGATEHHPVPARVPATPAAGPPAPGCGWSRALGPRRAPDALGDQPDGGGRRYRPAVETCFRGEPVLRHDQVEGVEETIPHALLERTATRVGLALGHARQPLHPPPHHASPHPHPGRPGHRPHPPHRQRPAGLPHPGQAAGGEPGTHDGPA